MVQYISYFPKFDTVWKLRDSASYPFVQVVSKDFKQYWCKYQPLTNEDLISFQSVFYSCYRPPIQSIPPKFFSLLGDIVSQNLLKPGSACPMLSFHPESQSRLHRRSGKIHSWETCAGCSQSCSCPSFAWKWFQWRTCSIIFRDTEFQKLVGFF